jgi:arylsulfatase A-like enzyme
MKSSPAIRFIMLIDMGFGQSGAFGGPIHMPTTALCSPTRAEDKLCSENRLP